MRRPRFGNLAPRPRLLCGPKKCLCSTSSIGTTTCSRQFPESFPLQVAVFWTNPGPDPENPLPLVHSLKEMGIPFFITRDLVQALRHRLVILYPSVDSRTFTQPQADQLTTFVRQGGFIFAQNVFWGGLQSVFGFRSFAAFA